MAADDGAMLHERLGSTFAMMAEESSSSDTFYFLNSFPSYTWQILILPFYIAIGIYMLIFLWKIFRLNMMMYKILLAFSFLAIAVILDFIEGIDSDSPFYIYDYFVNLFNVDLYSVEHFSRDIEELLEMMGITLFLAVFIEYIGTMTDKPIKIHLSGK